MTLGQLLAWLLWLATLLTRRQQQLWMLALTAMLGLRFVSQTMTINGSWLQRYAAVAFSPAGSLLLWANLVGLVALLTGRWLSHNHQPEVVYRRSQRLLLILMAFLLFAEHLSRPSTTLSGLASVVSILMVIHTLTIFGSYACQSVLLAYKIGAVGSEESLPRDQTMHRLVAAAAGLQLLGTVSGSVWASQAWGSPWSWDPIEFLSMATLIWLATLYLWRRNSVQGWYQLGLIVTPLYTIIGTVLVRSGLLARASLHGYLAAATQPALLAIMVVILVILVWGSYKTLSTEDSRESVPHTLITWGALHWLLGLGTIVFPSTKPMIVVLTNTSWLAAGAWLVAEIGTIRPVSWIRSKKP